MDTGSFCFDTLLSYRRHLHSDLSPHGGDCSGPEWPGLRHGPPQLASPHRSAVPLVHVLEACQSPELLFSTHVWACPHDIHSTRRPFKHLLLLFSLSSKGDMAYLSLSWARMIPEQFDSPLQVLSGTLLPALGLPFFTFPSVGDAPSSSLPVTSFLFQVLATEVLVLCQLTSPPHFPHFLVLVPFRSLSLKHTQMDFCAFY